MLKEMRRSTLVEQNFTLTHRAAKGSCHLNTGISAVIKVTQLHPVNKKGKKPHFPFTKKQWESEKDFNLT